MEAVRSKSYLLNIKYRIYLYSVCLMHIFKNVKVCLQSFSRIADPVCYFKDKYWHGTETFLQITCETTLLKHFQICLFCWLWLTLATYAGLSQCLTDDETPPPQVLLHSPHIDQGPQPPSMLWGQVPKGTHSP